VYQHRVIENIAKGPEKKISKTLEKISENIGKCRKTNISKNIGKISENIASPPKYDNIAMLEIILRCCR
jgi:hypothetical protein